MGLLFLGVGLQQAEPATTWYEHHGLMGFLLLRSATQRVRRMLLAKGAILCALLAFLEQKVNLPEEKITTLAATPKDIESIETLTMEVRRNWGLGLGPIGNMTNLLERNGIMEKDATRSSMRRHED